MSKFDSGRFEGTRGSYDKGVGNPNFGGAGGNSFPLDPSRIGHIFRNDEGHIKDTPTHRAEVLFVANDPHSYLGTDKWGNHWFAQTSVYGTQTWVQVRNGTIINAGRNDHPVAYNPITGLSRNRRRGHNNE